MKTLSFALACAFALALSTPVFSSCQCSKSGNGGCPELIENTASCICTTESNTHKPAAECNGEAGACETEVQDETCPKLLEYRPEYNTDGSCKGCRAEYKYNQDGDVEEETFTYDVCAS
ncbi:MAG: hypothetical protein RLY93_04710 [Sumerlaeia bacterium]